MRWKEKDFLPKKSTGIGMYFLKGKLSFIENDIARNIHSTSGNIEALNTLVLCTIAKEDTLWSET